MPRNSIFNRQTGSGALSAAASVTLYTVSIPPRSLENNKRVRLQMFGSVTTTLGVLPSVSFTSTYGSTSVTTPSFAMLGALNTVMPFRLIVHLSALNSVNAQQMSIEVIEFLSVSSLSQAANTRFVMGSLTENAANANNLVVAANFTGILVNTTIQRTEGYVQALG